MNFVDIITSINIRESKQILLENKSTYKSMMSTVISILESINHSDATKAATEAALIQKTYKRSDRIIWALRFLRIRYLVVLEQYYLENDTPIDIEKWLNKVRITWTKDFLTNNPTYQNIDNVIRDATNATASSMFAQQIAHFMSYTNKTNANYIKDIDELVFQWQTPLQIIDSFKNSEKIWQENRNREIEHASSFYSNAEKIIAFDDGFAWWNTNEEYCTAEGDAMGHCGNDQGRGGSGDRVLSLRQDITRGNVTKQIPYLTFILDKDDILGEMKGRNNDKPAARYHPYIVALLKSDYVDGIKGGGYDPANNFSVNDLDPGVKADLIAAKPSLETISDKFDRLGPTPEVLEDIENAVFNAGAPDIYDIVQNGDSAPYVILERLTIKELSYLFKPLEGAIDFEETVDNDMDDDERHNLINSFKISENDMLDIFHYMSDEYIQPIADDLGITGNVRDYKTKDKIAQYIGNSKYDDILRSGIVAVTNSSRKIDSAEWQEYISILVDIASAGLNQLLGVKLNNGDVDIIIDLSDLVQVIDANIMDDDMGTYMDGDEHYQLLYDVTHSNDGWVSGYKEYNAIEDFDSIMDGSDNRFLDDKDADLVRKIGTIIASGSDRKIDEFNHADVADWFMRYIRYNESSDEDFENMLLEVKRMSGIMH